VPIAKDLQALGFGLMATYHTAAFLRKEGIKDVQSVLKVQEGRPNAGVRGVVCRKLWRNDARRTSKSMCHWSAVSQCTQLDVLLALPASTPIPHPPHVAGDLLKNGDIQMMIITTAGDESDVRDGKELRRAALAHKVPIITTIAAARATVEALKDMSKGSLELVPLQDYFPKP
jgi:hypothetical protein